MSALPRLTVGLTYDLRDEYRALGWSNEASGEFDEVETIDALACAIRAQGHAVERIGSIRALVGALAAGKRWDLVFNIAEGAAGIAREAQIPALLEAYGVPFTFSTADVLVKAMDKALAKLVVRAAGVPTPDFAVIADPVEIARLDLPYPLFVKPLAEGTSKGVAENSRVTDPAALEARCRDVLARYGQPALVETFLPGREFTVGLLGTGTTARVIGVSEIRFRPGGDPSAYSYRNKAESFDELRPARDAVAEEAGRVALAAWRALGCRDAGRIDIRCDAAGRPQFIEANPLAGLRPNWSELVMLAEQAGICYERLVGNILDAAMTRLRHP